MRHIPGTTMYLPAPVIDEMSAGLRRVLQSGRLILGDETEAFEEACRAVIGTTHAVGVSTGTAALEIALRALDVAGHSVVVPANTFFATAIAVVRAGGEPVLADVGDDMLLDEASLARAWRDDTCGAIVVHLGGMMPADLGSLVRVAGERDGFVVEDSAQALGSQCPVGRAGAVGVAAATSFYPTKIVTAGEGGILSTADDEIARRALIMRDQGKAAFGRNHHVLEGYSWRLSELHAVVGLAHVQLLDDVIEQRRRIAAVYDERLEDSVVHVVPEPDGHRWNRYKYVVVLPDGVDREHVRAFLAARDIGLSGEVFAEPLHRQPVFAERFDSVHLPNAERVCAQHVCLPIAPEISDDEAAYIADALKSACSAETGTDERTVRRHR